ncbi:MAG: transcription termination factor Rho [Candidatus Spyradosoma sp.]
MDHENPEIPQEELSLNTSAEAAPEAVPAAPKRRGRPPKNPDAPATPKRPRGRPRKVVEDAPATDAPAPAAAEVSAVPAAPVSSAPEAPAAAPAPVAETPAVAPAPEPAAVPKPPRSVFSFDPEEEEAPAPAARQEAPAEDSPAPGRVPAAGVAAPEASAAPAKPWEKKPWKPQKPWERAGGSGAPQQGAGTDSAPKPWEKKERPPFPPKPPKFGGGKFNPQGKFEKFRNDKSAPKRGWGELANTDSAEEASLTLGAAFDYNLLNDEGYLETLSRLARHVAKRADGENPFLAPSVPAETAPDASETGGASAPAPAAVPGIELAEDLPAAPIDFNEVYESSMATLIAAAKSFGIPVFRNPVRRPLVKKILRAAFEEGRPIAIKGTLEPLADGNGLLLYGCDAYRVKELSAFVPQALIKKFGLQRGHDVEAVAFPPMKGETAPIVVHVTSIMGADPASVKDLTPFTELTPYYPTERIMLETDDSAAWNNLSMRCVDLLCPIGLGQRGLIVAPPRTGKTVLMQAIANSVARNKPNAHLIILLVDERPEEVTDFRRKTTRGEVVASTFDESAENHVHVAEMVIERARRMVELGKDVIILLDSITRLARAYNTLMPNGGKILSGGVEAGALSKPKRFFGSARNIEGGGSLTILGTALVDTGSKMDEVIFEEFKGTGNMELDLDRDLANKRIYPAINFERSGTRKEELLYHPQEMQCVYSMRRAMKGVPSIEAMEMLISRMKKTRTNAEFLMTLASR